MSRRRRDRSGPACRIGRGFTLAELLIAMTITSMLSVVLGGIVMAVETAWQYTSGLEDATTQASATVERIRYLVAQAAVYRTGDGTTPGIAVVRRPVGATFVPDVLVVWSGGRQGGLRHAGVLTRRPRIDELVIYTCRPDAPDQLVEITFPGETQSIDFQADDFSDTIRGLLSSEHAESVLLCDRVRTSALTAGGTAGESRVGNVRFQLIQRPGDDEFVGVARGTEEWYRLAWAQGVAGSDWGLRQLTLRIELQVETRPNAPSGTPTTTTAIPFFGSATYRYAHHP